jgi:lipoprotein-releasing system permease protein
VNFLFAWRYFKAKKSTQAINIIAWVSVLAMGVGTAALILMLSVFNGFENLVKSLYADFYTDLRVLPGTGKFMHLSPDQQQRIASWPGVKSVSLSLEERALLQNGYYQGLVSLKGVDDRYSQVSKVPGRVVRGRFQTGNADHPVLVLGAGVENILQVTSDRTLYPITVYLPRKGRVAAESEPLQSLGSENIFPAGAFVIQQDFDNNYAFTNLGFMQKMLGMDPDQYGAAEISCQPGMENTVRDGLGRWLGPGYLLQTRFEQNQGLYSTMQLERWFIFFLLSFILVLSAFTMIGSLSMLVLEKQKDIQILKAMGSSNRRVQGIFLAEGMLLGLIGGLGGLLLAAGIGWAQVKWKIIKLQGNTFLIDYYPVKFLAFDILLVLSTVMLIALVASWIPARKAGLQPLELRS